MNVMWTALMVFAVVCLMSYLIVNNLYLKLELKDTKEKLSWYTMKVDPVSTVWAEPEEYIDE